jgi:hypothetical protein
VLYFAGYVSIAELPPLMSNLHGHVVLSLARLASLPALLGVLACDTGRSARPNALGYMLSFVGAAVFSWTTWPRAWAVWPLVVSWAVFLPVAINGS